MNEKQVMRIALGCDPNAAALKQTLIAVIKDLGHEWKDFGSDDLIYANVGITVAKEVALGHYDRGVLLCGTGIGMSISANKVRGAFAALVSDLYSARKAVTSNKANIICMGAFTLGAGLAEDLLKVYLGTTYIVGTASEKKLERYVDYDDMRGG